MTQKEVKDVFDRGHSTRLNTRKGYKKAIPRNSDVFKTVQTLSAALKELGYQSNRSIFNFLDTALDVFNPEFLKRFNVKTGRYYSYLEKERKKSEKEARAAKLARARTREEKHKLFNDIEPMSKKTLDTVLARPNLIQGGDKLDEIYPVINNMVQGFESDKVSLIYRQILDQIKSQFRVPTDETASRLAQLAIYKHSNKRESSLVSMIKDKIDNSSYTYQGGGVNPR